MPAKLTERLTEVKIEREKALADVARLRADLERSEKRADEAAEEHNRIVEAIEEHLPRYVLDDGTGDEASPAETVEHAGDEIGRLRADVARLKAERDEARGKALEEDFIHYKGGSLEAPTVPSEAWAIFTGCEGEDPQCVGLLLGTAEDVERRVLHHVDDDGDPLYFDPHVAPAVLVDGRWWVSNHYAVDTHEKLRTALAEVRALAAPAAKGGAT